MSEAVPIDEKGQRILAERARALARPLESEEEDDTGLVVLVLGPERYGVDIRRVRETRPLEAFSPVPGTPEFWIGLVNVRGTLYPLLDLRCYLGLPDEDAVEGPKKLVLVDGPAFTVGLVVDDAPGVRRVPTREIGPALPGGSDTGRQVTSGVTRDLLAVLDLDALMTDPRLAVREESR